MEEETGVSNSYLSQLESGKIAKPSPQILKKLANFYSISYNWLMDLAGHPAITTERKIKLFKTSSGVEEISPKEEKELLEYLRFLRSRRSRR